jgi:hypothetical protein
MADDEFAQLVLMGDCRRDQHGREQWEETTKHGSSCTDRTLTLARED